MVPALWLQIKRMNHCSEDETDQLFKNILQLWSFGEAEPLQRGSACWMLHVTYAYFIMFQILTKVVEYLLSSVSFLIK